MCAKFFFAELKAQRDEGSVKILLSNNTGSWAAILQPIRFQYVGSFNFNLTPLYIIYVYS